MSWFYLPVLDENISPLTHIYDHFKITPKSYLNSPDPTRISYIVVIRNYKCLSTPTPSPRTVLTDHSNIFPSVRIELTPFASEPSTQLDYLLRKGDITTATNKLGIFRKYKCSVFSLQRLWPTPQTLCYLYDRTIKFKISILRINLLSLIVTKQLDKVYSSVDLNFLKYHLSLLNFQLCNHIKVVSSKECKLNGT